MQADYNRNTTFARRAFKTSTKGDQYRKQTHKNGYSDVTTAVAHPPTPTMSQPTPMTMQASSDTVQVLLHNLPNTLCNEMCMEAMLEQAWLGESVLKIEVQPGSPCGSARLHFSAWVAANQCVRHFQGCRWDQTGVPVYAEIYQASGVWMPDSGTAAPEPSAEVSAITATPVRKELSETKAAPCSPKHQAAFTPTLTSSTSPPRSPMGSPLSCKSESATRKISWADLCSDDEDSTTGPWSTEETQERSTDSSGSGCVGASDDGF